MHKNEADKKKYLHEYYLSNQEKIKAKSKLYKRNNKEKIKQYNKKYNDATKEIRKLKQKQKEHNDINYKIARRLRNRLLYAIKDNYKSGSAVNDLGCSIQELKKYLELKFLPGMLWENYGYGDDKWHIDHIKPLSKFDLTIRKQFLEACHYTNLQPLWQKDNISKGSK